MTDHRVLCAVLRLKRIDFSVWFSSHRQTGSRCLSWLCCWKRIRYNVWWRMDATTRLILTDSETKIDARLFSRLMQIFDASTTASWKARGVGQSFKGLGNGFKVTLRLELQTPRGTPSDVQDVALTINWLDKILTKSQKLWRKIVVPSKRRVSIKAIVI